MQILIPEVMDAGAVDWLKQRFDVHYDPELFEERPRMLEALSGATGVIVKDRTQVNTELLASAAQLRVVGRLGVGLDNIDLPACKARNIAVFPATGANARSVAEYVICTALMLMRPYAYVGTAAVAAGEWPQKKARGGRELDGKTFGVVGLGEVGRRVAAMASGLGMRVLVWAPTKTAQSSENVGARAVEMRELLAQSDIVTIHIPLTAETRGLLGRDEIAVMKKGAMLINTARAGIVDDAALVEAIRNRELGGAAIDVFEPEPLGAGSIFADPPPNLILTPHIAGGTVESTERRGTVVAERVAAYLSDLK
jgi:(S)-sulfolactate dehydrogenase